ncbi:unnamed protein product [Orchesella dallaii]|uniref:Uncharacterized protein n=1 Tax=Orchesella dallaii TaxID=48710 RepID=A0ABP1QZ48_9HEXA
MYRYKQDLTGPSRFVQPKIGAWAVSKSSTHKLTQSSQLKTETKTNLTRRPTGIGSSQKAGKGATEKPNLLGVIKAVLEDDSQDFSKRLNALEPSVTSLAQAIKVNTKSKPQRKKQSLMVTSESVAQEKMIPKSEIEFGRLLVPPIIQGEKLVTIGGYIISLQSKHEHISCMVKPRVSSDKDGLELEIKVTGCHPSEIKFEKRYNTLIVIGVNKGPPRNSDGLSTTFFTGGTTKKWSKDMTLKSLTTKKDITLPIEQPDEILEVVNIFVPKNTPLAQIYISKPDAKGRIFVKGP